jgi:WD repeat-containing protein 17
MRLFDMTNLNPMPLKVFTGHHNRVYNVLFNPNMPNICVSGSDDRTIRVWDIQKQGCTPIKVLGGDDVKGSHTSNVRALAFLPEISWCLISGSWDSTIKLWDIRSGHCMFTMVDHNSDVYGISLHPERPFLYASCSRDTTIRLFSIDGLVSALKIQLLID